MQVAKVARRMAELLSESGAVATNGRSLSKQSSFHVHACDGKVARDAAPAFIKIAHRTTRPAEACGSGVGSGQGMPVDYAGIACGASQTTLAQPSTIHTPFQLAKSWLDGGGGSPHHAERMRIACSALGLHVMDGPDADRSVAGLDTPRYSASSPQLPASMRVPRCVTRRCRILAEVSLRSCLIR